ncbi:hypothetical protein JXA85_03885 [Candidatus Woesearchaeota archaeon]|nr:hypothetical protein [Candidatus Woesearchaeota archaeon]
MNKKTIIKIALISLLVILSGCSGIKLPGINLLGRGNSNQGVIMEQENVCLDNNGLDIRYMDNMPPERIYEDDKFYVSLALMNNGCRNIEKGKFTVSVDTDSLQLEESPTGTIEQDISNFRGKSKFNPDPELRTLTYTVDSKRIPQDRKFLEKTITAHACYEYETIASAEICINPFIKDMFDIRNDVCQPGAVTLDETQGSPVVVSKIITKTTAREQGADLEFYIFVKNIGLGKVKEYNEGECSGSQLVKIEEVRFSDFTTAGNGFNKIACEPMAIKMRTEDENYVRCKATLLEKKAAYTTLMSIRLSYAYDITNTATVIITKPEE